MKIVPSSLFPIRELRSAELADIAIHELGENPDPEKVKAWVDGPPPNLRRLKPGSLTDDELVWSLDRWSLERLLVDFHFAGRQIFAFTPDLVREFAQTDVDDIRVDFLKLPFSSFYIHFEEPVAPENVLGVFFARDHLRAVLADQSLTSGIKLNADRSEAMTVGDLIEADATRFGQIAAQQKDVEVADEANAVADFARDTGPLLFRLFVNCICFVEYYRDFIKTEWPEVRPKAVQKATASRAAEKKLWSHGFNKVYLCAMQSEPSGSLPLRTGRETTPHWRRGHWRHQAYGPGFASRRLIWVRPVIVNREKGEPPAGHIYQA